jgi:hypothetical protein
MVTTLTRLPRCRDGNFKAVLRDIGKDPEKKVPSKRDMLLCMCMGLGLVPMSVLGPYTCVDVSRYVQNILGEYYASPLVSERGFVRVDIHISKLCACRL